MIRTIIVDDEIDIVEGLETLIPWGDYKFQIIGIANNAQDAITMAKEKGIDLLITDISMPSMNGLELIREMKANYKELKTILLTCHSSFDYAKEAIELEVDDYLVKHTLTKEVLLTALHKVKLKVEEKKRKDNIVHKAKTIVNQNRFLLVDKYFEKLMNTSFDESMKEKAEQLQINLPNNHYRTIGILIENYEVSLEKGIINDSELLKFTIVNILEELFQELKHQYIWWDNKGCLYFLHWNSMEKSGVCDKLICSLKHFMDIICFLKIPISVYITEKYYHLSHINDSINEIRKMQSYSFYNSHTLVYNLCTPKTERTVEEEFQTLRKNVINNIKEGNQAASIHSLDLLLHTLKLKNNPLIGNLVLEELLMELRYECSKTGINLDNRYLSPINMLGFQNTFQYILDVYFANKNVASAYVLRDEIDKVLSYIEEHIGERITCEEMANYVNMSRSYFSRLFKQEMGKSFSDYVLTRKIEYAKDVLMDSSITVQDVSEKVGFDTVSNFYRMFKKIIGSTPKQIRDNHIA